jgi:hypothetical protein
MSTQERRAGMSHEAVARLLGHATAQYVLST